MLGPLRRFRIGAPPVHLLFCYGRRLKLAEFRMIPTQSPLRIDHRHIGRHIGPVIDGTAGHKARHQNLESLGLKRHFRPVGPIGIRQAPVLITVMMAKPCHREGQTIFITAFGNIVEIVVRVDRVLAAASICGICVENVTVLVSVKDTDARGFRTWKFGQFVVVVDLATAYLLWREGSVEVVIEVAVVRRDPIELPAQPLLECIDLRDRCAGHGGKGDVALREMHQGAVGVIHIEGAAGAAFLPLGAEHEVVDDELASAIEQVSESLLSGGRVEDVILFDFDPGKLAAFGCDGVALVGEFLLFGEESLPGYEPFLSRDYLRVIDCACRHFHCSLLFVFEVGSDVLFFLRGSFTARAARPPVETVPATTSPRVPKQNGHIVDLA